MLVLSRKLAESIHIGDSIVVSVLEIRGNMVRIGIAAPQEIHVLRTELRDVVSKLPSGFVAGTVASS
jgi:carbon storage regulator